MSNTVHDIGLAKATQSELNHLFVGSMIARGTYREVYELMHDASLVLKYEARPRCFNNAIEWEIWNEVKGAELARWLAPCIQISFSGSFLIQARTQPITEMPDEVPDFLADLKLENFGLYEGRVVAHDYANNHLFSKGLRRLKMVKIRKRGDNTIHWTGAR